MAATVPFEGNLANEVQSKQLRLGVLVFTATTAIGLILASVGVSTGIRLSLFVPFLMGSYMLVSGLFKTCAFVAAKGVCMMSDGMEGIGDCARRSHLKRLGTQVIAGTFAMAAVATALLAI